MTIQILCFVLLGLGPIRGQVPSQALTNLIASLEDRDSRLQSVYLGFKAREEPLESDRELGLYMEGWWAMSGEQFAAEVFDLTISPASRTYGYWDGQIYRRLLETPGTLPTVHLDASVRTPFTTYTPLHFGLGYNGALWGSYLRGEFGGKARVLGREPVGGVDCLKVLIDLEPAPGAALQRPLLVWFDDAESLLALQMLLPDWTSHPEHGSTGTFEILGQRFSGRLRWEVEQYAKAAKGVWVPTRGRQYFLYPTETPSLLVEMDERAAAVNAPFVNSLFRLPITDWVPVIDHIRDTKYALGPAGDEGDLNCLSFHQALREACERRGSAYRPGLEGYIPFNRSSCGPNAVFFLSALYGTNVPLDALLENLSPEEIKGRYVSLKRLVDLLRLCGLEGAAVGLDSEDLRRHVLSADTSVIVHLDESALARRLVESGLDPEAHVDHLAIVTEVDDVGVVLLSPPYPPERHSLESFAGLWSGKAVLASPRQLPPAPEGGSGEPWLRFFGIVLAGSGVGGLVMLLRSRHRSVQA